MVGKVYLPYFSYIHDTSVGSPPFLDSVRVAKEFMDVFPMDLLGMPQDRDTDFSISVESGTKSISIYFLYDGHDRFVGIKATIVELF